jgi:hypothetical protein
LIARELLFGFPATDENKLKLEIQSRRREIALDICCVILVLAPFVVLWMPRARGPIDLRYDAGVYYTLGTSLFQGTGYRLLNEPGEIPANQYPPLLPAIVAVHELALGTGDPAVVGPRLRLTFFLFSLGFLVAGYYLAKQYVGRGLAVLAGLICALHVDTMFFSDLCFAEIPFGLVTIGFFLVQGRWEKWGQAAQAALGVAAFFLRTLGIALLAAWVAEALLGKQWTRAAIRAGVALVPFFLWQGYVAHVRSDPSYVHPAYAYQRAAYMNYNVSYAENMSLIDPFIPELGKSNLSTRLLRLAQNVADMPATLGEMVSTRRQYWGWTLKAVGKWIGHPGISRLERWPCVALGVVVLIGLGTFALRREWLVLLYMLGTTAMICLTPWPGQFMRYLVPVGPLAAIALFRGLTAMTTVLQRRASQTDAGKTKSMDSGPIARRVSGALLVGVISVVLSAQMYALRRLHDMRGTANYTSPDGVTRPYVLFFYDPAWQAFEHALTWLKANAQGDDIVITSAPYWTWLWTGLKAAQPAYEADSAVEQRQLETVGATYLILDAFVLSAPDVSRRYAEPAVQAHPEAWELAYTTPVRPVRVYRRHR